jgi:hypothetical protein
MREERAAGGWLMSFHKFAVGVVLALAMVAVLAVSALVFSARDFQYGLGQVAPATNGLIAFDKLREADVQIRRLEAESAAPRGELLEIEQAVAAIDNRITSSEAAANETRAAMVGSIAVLAPASQAAADLSTPALTQQVAALAAQPGLSPAQQQTVAALTTQAQQLAQQEEALGATDAERAALVARQRTVGGQVAEANRAIFALQASVVPNYEFYGRVRGEVNALTSMSPYGVSAFLAQGHPALLSTMLVLLMGALGSLLYLFPAYLNRAEPVTVAEIVVRLIFGACASLAFYVLANAAIAGFAFGSGAEQATTSSALNPFTVSLIGIVAGVLSEDIAKWIQDRGRGMFQQGASVASIGAAPAPAEPAHQGGGLVNNQAIS